MGFHNGKVHFAPRGFVVFNPTTIDSTEDRLERAVQVGAGVSGGHDVGPCGRLCDEICFGNLNQVTFLSIVHVNRATFSNDRVGQMAKVFLIELFDWNANGNEHLSFEHSTWGMTNRCVALDDQVKFTLFEGDAFKINGSLDQVLEDLGRMGTCGRCKKSDRSISRTMSLKILDVQGPVGVVLFLLGMK